MHLVEADHFHKWYTHKRSIRLKLEIGNILLTRFSLENRVFGVSSSEY